MASWAGRLLVATPLIEEPIFHRTVIAVLQHDEDGAVGVVLNRPSELPVGEPFPDWDGLAVDPPVMFAGGPVAPSAVVCLARAAAGDPPPGWTAVMEGIGALDLQQDAALLRAGVAGVRLFAGYAGWGGGQLESEVEEGGWVVVDAAAGDALTDRPDGLWRDVLLRQPQPTRLMAWFPPDITLQ